MRKAWLVARREFGFNVRRPGYLFAAFGMPVFVVVVMVIVGVVIARLETDTERLGNIGYADLSGVLADGIEEPDEFVRYEDEAALEAAFAADEIGAYFVVPEDYVERGRVTLYSEESVPDILDADILDYLQVNLAAQVDSEIPVERFLRPVDATYYFLQGNRTLNEGVFVLFFLPIAFVILYTMASQISSSYLMRSVVEEKTNRLIEILMTSVTPMELLLGKIIGLGALGLTQMVVWAAVGALVIFLGQTPAVPLPEGFDFSLGAVPLDLVLLTLVYFLLSYLLMGAIMASIGVIAGSDQESRQYAAFFVLVPLIPYFFMVSFLENSDGLIPVILTLIPFTSALAAILRIGFGGMPVWQLALSLGLLAATNVVAVWLAARIFRWGALLYGKRITPRTVLRLLRKPARSGTLSLEEKAA